MKNILFVVGSLREASASLATARAIADRLGADASFTYSDIGALPHYNDDLGEPTAVADWKAQLAAADGLIFCTPEYNYGIPGVLKNAIDWASRPGFNSVFKDKKCFVISVSGGALGGVRAQSDLKYTLNGLLADTYVCKEVVVPMANKKITDGKLDDAAILDFAEENLRGFVTQL